VLAGEHQLELGGVERRTQGVDGGLQIVAGRLPFAHQLDQGRGVVGLCGEGALRLDRLGQAGAVPQDLLGFLRILEEIGVGGAGFELVETAFRCGLLKDAP